MISSNNKKVPKYTTNAILAVGVLSACISVGLISSGSIPEGTAIAPISLNCFEIARKNNKVRDKNIKDFDARDCENKEDNLQE